MRFVSYVLGVLCIVVSMGLVIVSLVVLQAVLHPARAQSQEPLVLYQLGACVHEPGDRPACVTLGTPLPLGVCVAMKKRLIVEGFPGRPVCARVLVDATDE